jgi:hypothetical protein
MKLKQNCIITDDKTLLRKFRVPKNINIYVIKDQNKRNWLAKNWAWRQLWYRDKKNKIWYVPPVGFLWASKQWYIPKNWKNLSTYELIESSFNKSMLYWYQSEAINKMEEYLTSWWKWFYIRSWTATGKSIIICGIVDRIKTKTLVVTPKKIISSQLYDDLSKYFKNVKEAPNKDIGKNIKELCDCDILVITHMTLNLYYDEINNSWFDTILLDEWHYVPVERSAQFAQWKWRNIVWLSANWQRKDVAEEHFPKLYWWYYNTWEEAAPVRVISYRYEYDYTIDELLKAWEWYAPDSTETNRKLLINNNNRIETLLLLLEDIKKKFSRIIIFVDRVELCEKLHNSIEWSYIMAWSYDNVRVKNHLLTLDSYILVAMEQCVREWMNIPNLEFGVMFFSSSELNTIQQLAWRVRRFATWKDFWYLLDFVDTIQVQWSKKKILWFANRKIIYKDLDFKVIPYEEFFEKDTIEVTTQSLF